MNWIALYVVGMIVMSVIVGLLLGLLRGSRRALLRLILVVVSFALAFALCGPVSKSLMNIKIPSPKGGEATLGEFLATTLSEAMSGFDLSSIGVALAQGMIKIMTFMLLSQLLLFLTWAIVFPICKIFVKPRKKDGKVKRNRPIGLVFGAVQGLIVGLVMCAVMSGLFFQTGRVAAAATDFIEMSQSESQPDEDTSDSQNSPAEVPEFLKVFAEYPESGTGKFFDKVSGKFFASLSQVKTEDGKKVTLPGTIDAIDGVVKMAKAMVKLENVNFADMFVQGGDFQTNFDELQKILKELDNVNGDLSKEARETIMSVLNGLNENMDLPVDFSSIDLSEVKFAEEADIIKDLHDYSQKDTITNQEAEDILGKLVDSNIALPVLQSAGVNAEDLPSQQKEVISDILDDMEAAGEAEQSKIDALRDLFGL